VRLGVLTSSRADYGIYRPLLQALEVSSRFETAIIAFGAHFDPVHGNTYRQIEADGFRLAHRLKTLVEGDTAADIAGAMGLTLSEFARFWAANAKNFDLVFALGDRFEMFAAVSATVPFNMAVAHIHGGERTLGSIDDKFRDSITRMAGLHFTAAREYKERVAQILGSDRNIHVVGALGLDNLKKIRLLGKKEFQKEYGIDLSAPTILLTFHPETVHPERSGRQAETIVEALRRASDYRIVITMPNLDTAGSAIRRVFEAYAAGEPGRVRIVENFGTRGYFSCMSGASLVMGNSSSGIIEAASFGKYAVNIGERQAGRIAGRNVIHVPVSAEEILAAVKKIEKSPPPGKENPYWQGGAAKRILEVLSEKNHV